MSDFNKVNGATLEGKMKSSCEDGSYEKTPDHSSKASAKDEDVSFVGEQKSPKATKSSYGEKSPNVSCKDKSPKISVEKCTPDGENIQKSFSEILDEFNADLESSDSYAEDILGKEEISSEILGEDTPKRDKSSESLSFTPEKDKSDESLCEKKSEKKSSPKTHVLKFSTASASKKMKTPTKDEDKLIKSPEKRSPRINRRGFRLNRNSLENLEDEPKSGRMDRSLKWKSLASTSKASENAPVDKEKGKIFSKRKQSCSDEKKEKNESPKDPDSPPRKKHKPITWP